METITTKIANLHNLTMSEALLKVTELSTTPGLDIVVTPNIDHFARLVAEGAESKLASIYQNASLCLCDSRILEKMLRFKNKTVKDVITGSSLTENLINSDRLLAKKVAIIGGSETVFQKLKTLYPTLDLYHYNPPMGFIDSEIEVAKVVGFLSDLSADVIFLAVGSPRQEFLADKLKEQLNHGVALCIGASILFIVGEEHRAPVWIQKIHLEWAFRMLQNPKVLMKRYLGNFLQIPRIYAAL